MKAIVLGGKQPPNHYNDFIVELYEHLDKASHGNLLFITDVYLASETRMSTDLLLFKELDLVSREDDSICLVFGTEYGSEVYVWSLSSLFDAARELGMRVDDLAGMMLNREKYEKTMELHGYFINARGYLNFPYEKAKRFLHVEIKEKRYFESDGACLVKEMDGMQVALQMAWKLDKNLLLKQGVYDDLLQYWGKDKEELFETAMRNTQDRFPAMVYTSGENYRNGRSPMYLSQFAKYDSKRPVVVDTCDMTFCAILIYYDNLLLKMAEHWGDGFVFSIVNNRAVVFAPMDVKPSLLNRTARCVTQRFGLVGTQQKTYRCTSGDLSIIPCELK